MINLSSASKLVRASALCVFAAWLTAASEFSLRCHVQQHNMSTLLRTAEHRQSACLELGWRWQADDQEQQYRPGTSAGSNATVGPIAGFVMDVTENEYGHAEGQCHALHASYTDLFPAK